MKFVAMLILSASLAASAQSAPAPSPELIEQKIQTLLAVQQVYFDRLDTLDEFRAYIQAEKQIQQLRQQAAAARAAADADAKAKADAKGATKK